MNTVIDVRNLNKTFYYFQQDYKVIPWLFTHKGNSEQMTALNNVTFSVKKGEAVGFIGKNGAGKSTLMKLVAGVTFPSGGSVSVTGKVGALINLSAGFDANMTGRQNIYYKGMLLGISEEIVNSIMADIVEFVDIGEYFDMPLRTYSSGMSARLGFALAVFSDPDILIIDEVFAVGDRAFQEKSRQKTIKLFQSGKAILFSSHSDSLIRQFCNRVIYLRNSEIIYDGEVEKGLSLYWADTKAAMSK